MSERMTDERFARFQDWYGTEQCWSNHESELFVALRAERAEVARLTQLCSTEFDEMGDEQYSEWVNEAGKQKIKDLMKELADAHGVAQACEARAEAAEAKLAKVLEGMEEIARSGDIEGFGEFIRGQASGWNQCRAQVQAIIKEAGDE